MRRLALLALLALALSACDPGLGPAPSTRGSGRGAVDVRVATWNVHDLFDALDDVDPPGALDDVPSPPEVELKLARVAAVLARLDADVVLLEEVESAALLARLAAAGGYPEARLVEGNDPRGIDVAVLSRLPVRAYLSHADERGPDGRLLWPRDCVEAHLDAGGARLVLVGSHFSSSLSDDGTRRAWQAARMRAIAEAAREADAGALVLAGGDLNDAPGSAGLAPLLADGRWQDPAPPGAVTWPAASPRARLDYLVVPEEALSSVVGASIAGGADVALASDHLAVVLDVRWR